MMGYIISGGTGTMIRNRWFKACFETIDDASPSPKASAVGSCRANLRIVTQTCLPSAQWRDDGNSQRDTAGRVPNPRWYIRSVSACAQCGGGMAV